MPTLNKVSCILYLVSLKVVTHLKSASGASYDVINMATINRNCSLIKAVVCIVIVVFIQHKFFLTQYHLFQSHDG